MLGRDVAARPAPAPIALEMRGVGLDREGTRILDGVDWGVEVGQHWVVLGPNGSGKTSLLRIASLYTHPSRGEVAVDGEWLGRTDVRSLRRRIGLASPAFGHLLRPQLRSEEHTSELQSLMRISYAVFCLKKNKQRAY